MASHQLVSDETVSRMARALRPFHNIDLPGLARAALVICGFDAGEINRFAPQAVRVETLRRRAMRRSK